MYKITFLGLEKTFASLLPAMELRQQLLSCGLNDHAIVDVWQQTSDGWTLFDAERFLDGLRVLLAPAE